MHGICIELLSILFLFADKTLVVTAGPVSDIIVVILHIRAATSTRRIEVRLPSFHTFIITKKLIQFFSNPLHCSQIDDQTLWNCSFLHECQAVQNIISKFLEEWIVSWHCFPYGQCSIDSSLLHSRQNLKQTMHIPEINKLKG